MWYKLFLCRKQKNPKSCVLYSCLCVSNFSHINTENIRSKTYDIRLLWMDVPLTKNPTTYFMRSTGLFDSTALSSNWCEYFMFSAMRCSSDNGSLKLIGTVKRYSSLSTHCLIIDHKEVLLRSIIADGKLWRNLWGCVIICGLVCCSVFWGVDDRDDEVLLMILKNWKDFLLFFKSKILNFKRIILT